HRSGAASTRRHHPTLGPGLPVHCSRLSAGGGTRPERSATRETYLGVVARAAGHAPRGVHEEPCVVETRELLDQVMILQERGAGGLGVLVVGGGNAGFGNESRSIAHDASFHGGPAGGGCDRRSRLYRPPT